MTFVRYAWARRLGTVFQASGAGERVVMAQLEAGIVPGRTRPLEQAEAELAVYFAGRSMRFDTPRSRAHGGLHREHRLLDHERRVASAAGYSHCALQ